MRLKKIIVLTVCILCMYSLVGCQKETENRQYPDGIKEELEQKVPNSVKNNQNTSNEAEQEENEALQYVTVPREEILAEDMFSYRVQFGGEIIELSLTVQALLDKGAVISDDHTEAALVEAGRHEYVEFKLNGTECKFVCTNNSDERTTLNNCIIDGVSVTEEGVFFSKGVTIGMTLEEVTSKWGQGVEQTMNGLLYLCYRYDENETGFIAPGEDSGYIVCIKPNTGKVIQIQDYK